MTIGETSTLGHGGQIAVVGARVKTVKYMTSSCSCNLGTTFLQHSFPYKLRPNPKTTSAVLRSCEVFWLNKQTKKRPIHVAQRAKSSISRQCCCLRYALCHCASASTVSQFNLWDSSLCWIQARIFSPILILPLYSDTENNAS